MKMSTTTVLVTLRAAALVATLAGGIKAGNSLYALADLVESGKATDEHMKLVAEKLKSRELTDADWDDVIDRIEADHKRLQDS